MLCIWGIAELLGRWQFEGSQHVDQSPRVAWVDKQTNVFCLSLSAGLLKEVGFAA